MVTFEICSPATRGWGNVDSRWARSRKSWHVPPLVTNLSFNHHRILNQTNYRNCDLKLISGPCSYPLDIQMIRQCQKTFLIGQVSKSHISGGVVTGELQVWGRHFKSKLRKTFFRSLFVQFFRYSCSGKQGWALLNSPLNAKAVNDQSTLNLQSKTCVNSDEMSTSFSRT